MPPLTRIVFDSPTLSSLLSQSLTTGRDFDGLLFGQVREITETSLRDDDGPSETTRSELYVTGFCCNAYLYSFYDSNGNINLSQLIEAIGPKRTLSDVVGIVVSRAFTTKRQLTPNDQRLVNNLNMLLLDKKPASSAHSTVFGFFSPSLEHDNSCIVTGYTFFDCALERPPRPIGVHVRNLGSTLGRDQYEDVEILGHTGLEPLVKMTHAQAKAMERELLSLLDVLGDLAARTRDVELQAAEAEKQWIVKTGELISKLSLQNSVPAAPQVQRPPSRAGSPPPARPSAPGSAPGSATGTGTAPTVGDEWVIKL